ncbi:MAG: inorganic diphosphatase [Actinomycetota bacterium]
MEITVVVEIPKGSRNKYEIDHDTGRVYLDRVLHSAVHYPADYGYIDESLGGDGDPLDALVLLEQPTVPGCIITSRPVGVFVMRDEKGADEKILCVPLADPAWNHVTELEAVPPHRLKEIEHFFQVYKDLEGKKTEIEGWRDRPTAEQVITDALGAYNH